MYFDTHEIYTVFESPVGPLLLSGDGERLRRLHFASHNATQSYGRFAEFPASDWRHESDAFESVRRQLGEYFDGARRDFTVELDIRGSEFELKVWDALTTIPYGETRSYGEIARQVSDDIGASRAVGLVNGRNPVSIIVPCHRVIGANGSLTGYGGGLERKRSLLDLESGRLALL